LTSLVSPSATCRFKYRRTKALTPKKLARSPPCSPCRNRHDDAVTRITNFFSSRTAVESRISADQFRQQIEQEAARNFINAVERDDLVRQGFSTLIRAALTDSNWEALS
jgi:hypothetical protein